MSRTSPPGARCGWATAPWRWNPSRRPAARWRSAPGWISRRPAAGGTSSSATAAWPRASSCATASGRSSWCIRWSGTRGSRGCGNSRRLPSLILFTAMETLDRTEVETKVREVLAETLHRDVGEIGLDARLEDLGVASIDLITLVFELEDAFVRTLEDEDIAGLTTVRSVVDFLVAGGAGG